MTARTHSPKCLPVPWPRGRRQNVLASVTLLAAMTLALGWGGPTARAADDPGPRDYMREMTKLTYVLVLASARDFASARRQAEAIARRADVPFSMQGMVYDAKRGLILPDDADDPVYAGSYYLRRENSAAELPETGKPATVYLSVERSEAYEGFPKGRYIVVGGFYQSRPEAQRKLAGFARLAPGARLRRTPIFYGCIH